MYQNVKSFQVVQDVHKESREHIKDIPSLRRIHWILVINDHRIATRNIIEHITVSFGSFKAI